MDLLDCCIVAAPSAPEFGLLKTLAPVIVTACIGIAAVAVSYVGVCASRRNLERQLEWQREEEHKRVVRENIARFLGVTSDLHFSLLLRDGLRAQKRGQTFDPNSDVNRQMDDNEGIINSRLSEFDRLFTMSILVLNVSRPEEKEIETLMTKLYDIVRNLRDAYTQGSEIKQLQRQIFESTRHIVRSC